LGEDKYSIQILDYEKWSSITSEFLDHNYRQLWSFGKEAANRVRAKSEFVAIIDSNRVIGLASVRIKTLPFLNIGIAYIIGGPLVRKKDNKMYINAFKQCLGVLQDEYTQKRSLLLRIICPIGEDKWISEQNKLFQNAKFNLTNVSKQNRTLLVDIVKSEDEIRQSLHQKWRNCLNRSEKSQLEVTRGTDSIIFQQLTDLYSDLRERKKFDVDLEPDFYQKVQQNLPEHEKFVVHVAKFDGKPVAAHLGSYLGDTAVYLLGASNQEGNKLNASYLLQWVVMLYAKQKGCTWYDLGGIDPDNNPGVYRFKQRMGGIELTAPGPYEALPEGLKGRFIRFTEKVYRTINN
jgi:lipid II:glycine glycyltransferase (peptidoglycan interpeptide bridge formation enzyme)